VLLINARLLGRIGWLLSFHTPDPPEKQEPKKKTLRRAAGVAVDTSDPWGDDEPEVPPDAIQDLDRPVPPPEPEHESMPEELEDEWGPPKPYRLSDKPPTAIPLPPKPARRPDPDEEADGIYGMLPVAVPVEPIPIPIDGHTPIGTPPPPKPPPGEGPLEYSGMDSLEERLAKGRENLAPPRFSLFSGVYTYPWYREALAPWLYLTLLGLLLGLSLHWQFLLWPFGRD
jgi:hypothetical protein